MPSYYSLQCPIESCEFHHKIITGPVLTLQKHIYRDHDYQEKIDTAIKLDLITDTSRKRSATWLSFEIAKVGIIND